MNAMIPQGTSTIAKRLYSQLQLRNCSPYSKYSLSPIGSPFPEVQRPAYSRQVVQPTQTPFRKSRFFASSSSSRNDTSNPSNPAGDPPIKSYSYSDIRSLLPSSSPSTSKKTILIDVREPSEYNSGHIPTAKNLPIMSRPDGIFLSKDEFKDVFGWEKPDVLIEGEKRAAEEEDVAPEDAGEKVDVVFYCKAGIRSRAAARLAWQGGWRGVGEYQGSWVDWLEKGGEKEGGK